MRILLAAVIVCLLIPLSVLAQPDPEDHVDWDWDRVFGPFDRVDQGAPDCDEPMAEPPCVAWSYYDFQGIPFAYTAQSVRSHDGATIYLALSTNPEPTMTGGGNGRPLTVHAIDAETGAERWVAQIDRHDRPLPTDVDLSDDGDVLVFSAYLQEDQTCAAYAVDAASGAELWSHTEPGFYTCRGIDITPDGSSVYIVGDLRNEANHVYPSYQILDADDGSVITVHSWEVDHQRQHDILALDDGSVYVTGQVSVGQSGGTSTFLTRFVDEQTVWEVRIPAVQWQNRDGRQPLLSADGATIYFGDHQNTGAVDVATGALLWSAPAPAADVTHLPDLVLSPDGSQLVVLDEQRLRVLDPVTGVVDWSLPHEQTRLPRDAAFSADGSSLVVLFERDNVVETYDAETGAELGSVTADSGSPTGLYLTEDGFIVATVKSGLLSQGVHVASYMV